MDDLDEFECSVILRFQALFCLQTLTYENDGKCIELKYLSRYYHGWAHLALANNVSVQTLTQEFHRPVYSTQLGKPNTV